MKKLTLALLFAAVVATAGISQGQSGGKGKYDPPAKKADPPKKAEPPKKTEPPKKADPPKEQPKGKYDPPKKTEPPKKEEPKKEEPKKAEPPSKYAPPPAAASGSANSTSRPPATTTSDKARANKEAASEKKFVATQKATAPPKRQYTTPDGKTVEVRTGSKQAEVIRNRPAEIHTPQARQQRTEVHVTQHHYHHPSTWYSQQPYVYVGSGYSSAFWWMMMEWDAERRARWLYHNRYHIERDAYERGLRDAEVSRRIAEMEAKRVYRDGDYVDPEFRDNPGLQYDQEYVEAVYNPTVQSSPPVEVDPGVVLNGLLWVVGACLGLALLYGLYHLMFKARFNA